MRVIAALFLFSTAVPAAGDSIRDVDFKNFVYAWPNLDTPLRMILTERPPELLPDWDRFIADQLRAGVQQLKEATW